MPPDAEPRPRAGLDVADGVSAQLLQLGSKLAAARHAQGLSLEDLAQRLHLGPSQLDALEAGDFTRLPEVVYVIAQARRVAASLGLDLEAELTNLRSSSPAPRPRPPRPQPQAFSVSGGSEQAAKRVSAPPGVARSGAAPLASLLPLAALLLGLGAAALALRPQPQPQPKVARAAQVTPASAQRPAEALVLSSQPASWVAVRDQAGQRLFEGMLSREQRFPLGGGLEVLAGRPDLVQVSLGQQPPRPLGTISDVAWRRFPAATSRP